jgi:hypothetical protein
VLAAWGMNIVKANAFSNQAGTVVDYALLYRSLPHFGVELIRVGAVQAVSLRFWLGEADLDRMLRDRQRGEKSSDQGDGGDPH